MRLAAHPPAPAPGSSQAPGPASGALTAAGFFALRTPLLPFDELEALAAGLEAARAPAEARARALGDDRRRVRERLRRLVERPLVREALFLASPSLEESLPAWLEAPGSERGRKVERPLFRYVERMCARPTPFGLFAGCSVGELSAATRLELEPGHAHRRHSRLDGDFLSSLCERLGRDPRLRAELVYRPNTSLYRAAGRLRYAEARLDGKRRSYHLVAVEPTDYLEATLARAQRGARLDELAAALVGPEVTREEADAFVHQLVDEQLLQPDLEPQVTGDEPVHDLVAQLAGAAGRPVAACLEAARDALSAIDAAPLGVPPATYLRIVDGLRDGLRALPAEVEVARLFQVDLVKPVRAATLGPAVVEELERVVSLLHRLAAPAETALDRFRRAFSDRYEAREVPLAEVLDEESGIGFDAGGRGEVAPLLDGLPFGAPPEGELRCGRLFDLLLGRLEAALAEGRDEIVLEPRDLEPYAAPAPAPLPDGLAAMVTLLAPSPAAVDAGDFQLWLHALGGPSGANLLGRFCHADPALAEHVRRHLREEERRRPDALFVEVVHLPEGRIGNVLARPLLRGHELAFLGRSGAPPAEQLRLDDLLISVEDERVVLRSRRLGREIVPRLTTAHAFSNPRNLGVYRFLCALQYQGVASLGLGWGALERAPRVPRLRLGRVILEPARWRLDGGELERLAALDEDGRFAAFQALRARLRLPRWLSVVDGDNLLPVDLDNALSVDAAGALLPGRRELVLTELLPGAALVRGPEGAFTHELIIPMRANAARSVETRPAIVEDRAGGPLVRSFPPGSEWLYAKLYTGSATIDPLLREVIAPLVAAAQDSGAIDRWFFLRYGDPDWHLRVRFHGPPARLLGEVLPSLHAALAPALADGRVWKLQLDTYVREVERYGGARGIALAEAWFAADSAAALGLIERLAGDADAETRWRLVLRGLDRLLDGLGFDLPAKHALASSCRDGFAAELPSHARQPAPRRRRPRPGARALRLPRPPLRGAARPRQAPGLTAHAIGSPT